ncbi:MAG: hypothetical protein ACXWE9_12530 [Methylobacter sp.]
MKWTALLAESKASASAAVTAIASATTVRRGRMRRETSMPVMAAIVDDSNAIESSNVFCSG